MAGSPWICPNCGEVNGTDACTRCGHHRSLEDAGGNPPGSYLAIIHGRGCYDTPLWILLLVLGVIAAAFLLSLRL